MSKENVVLYEFGDFRLDPNQKILLHNGELIRMPAKTFDLLLALIRKNNRIVEKEELMREVWADAFVEEANLTVQISALRKILGNGNNGENGIGGYIETVPRRGYRFRAEVRETFFEDERPAEDSATKTEENPDIRLSATSDRNDAPENQSSFESSAAISASLPANSPKTKRSLRSNSALLAAVLILTAIFGTAYTFYRSFRARPSFQTMKINRIPETTKTRQAAISPDGKYIAHVVSEAGKQSIWIKHLATNSNVRLVAPNSVAYSPLTFSSDGNYIYFASNPRDDLQGELYRIPVLGGDPKIIRADVGSAISFAPDGERFVFVRNISPAETALMVADINGGAERQLAVRRKPEFFGGSAAWSPDGKTIVCSAGTAAGDRTSILLTISADDGTEKHFSERKWRAVGQIAWLTDGAGFVASAMETIGSESFQLWLFPFPDGEPQRITNDLNSYGGVTVTADSKTLVTIQDDIRRNIWLVPADAPNQAKSLTDNEPDAYRFVAWSPDKKIVYPSALSGNRDIWTMNADGSNRKQLTATAHNDILPSVCADGRYIVFSSNRDPRGTVNVWRMNRDGTNPIQITRGNDETLPKCTPDGKWIVFVAGGNDNPAEKRTIWKIPIDGGEPVQLTTNPSFGVDVSPNGKQFVCWYKSDADAAWKAAVVPIEGGQPIKFFDAAANSQLRWSPDASAVAYIKTENSVSNIWSQPINGDPPKQLTAFTTEQIWNFDWSGDNQLIFSRGVTTVNAISISNLR